MLILLDICQEIQQVNPKTNNNHKLSLSFTKAHTQTFPLADIYYLELWPPLKIWVKGNHQIYVHKIFPSFCKNSLVQSIFANKHHSFPKLETRRCIEDAPWHPRGMKPGADSLAFDQRQTEFKHWTSACSLHRGVSLDSVLTANTVDLSHYRLMRF